MNKPVAIKFQAILDFVTACAEQGWKPTRIIGELQAFCQNRLGLASHLLPDICIHLVDGQVEGPVHEEPVDLEEQEPDFWAEAEKIKEEEKAAELQSRMKHTEHNVEVLIDKVMKSHENRLNSLTTDVHVLADQGVDILDRLATLERRYQELECKDQCAECQADWCHRCTIGEEKYQQEVWEQRQEMELGQND